MKQKKISVIIPTFNRGWCIQRAIESVIKQSYKNWELIIIDDGSTDDTKEVVKKYLEDRRIKYYKLSKNKGVNFARNKGLDISSGEHVVFLDSDDEFLPHALKNIASEFDKTADKLVGVLLFNCVNQDSQVIGISSKNGTILEFEDWVKAEKFTGEKIGVLSKDVIDDGFRFADSRGQMEGYFWLSVAKKYKTKFINKAIRIYHTEHDDRLTGTGQMMQKAKHQNHIYNLFLEKFEKDILKIKPGRLFKIYFEKGINEILSNNPVEGRKSLRKAVKYNYKKLHVVAVVFILSFLPNRMFISLAKLGHRYKGVLN